MSEHTPGPWQQGVEGNNRVYGLDCSGDDSGLIAVVFKGRANVRLIAAAPDLLHAQTMGSSLNTPDFLDFVADRLVNVYGESPNVDFVLSLRSRAQAGRNAIAKAENG